MSLSCTVADKLKAYWFNWLNLFLPSTEFFGAISIQFSFTYTLECVTVMPQGLHARLCHAFLV